MAEPQYLTATEAAAALGVRVPTLYAYVSRGLIRSQVAGDARRTRRYYREDVQKLKERQEQRRNPAQVAAKALHWGAPVLESALTLIGDGRLYYRGHDALALATTQPFEAVAGLLWTGELSADAFRRDEDVEIKPHLKKLALTPELGLIERFQIALALAAAEDTAAYDLRPAAVIQTGVRILRLLTRMAMNVARPEEGIAHRLQQSWAPTNPHAAELLDAALVLCADHELNISSFTARCVASAGSTPYAAVSAALGALQGTKHGGNTKRVEALLREIGKPEHARRVLSNRLQRGELIPGFGQPLYPTGDPRGRLLLQLTTSARPRGRRVALARTVIDEAFRLIGEYPTIDLALVVLAQALDLPEDSPLALFALGRTAGWIAHAIEQYQLDQLIRPRARYVGPVPQRV